MRPLKQDRCLRISETADLLSETAYVRRPNRDCPSEKPKREAQARRCETAQARRCETAQARPPKRDRPHD
jgi:hypothetical protein